MVATTTTTPDLLPPAPPAADVVPLDLLGQLIVAPEAESATYDRDRFSHWIDADGNGCHTRCEVLAEERLDSLPGLAGGGWLSTYDGYSTDDASELEVDHVVALSEAWRSGAWSWSDARRRDFANDLDHPGALTAVTAATNRSKSDRDPSSWQPPNREAWCGYASDWVSTKVRWGLSADDAEVRALTNMLNGCGPVLRAVPPMLPAPAPAPTPTLDAPPAAGGCHPSYPEVCIPPAPPDLDCGDVSHRRFAVVGDDPHRFDGNDDGVGCES
ncbi:MAG: HNH endonuclease [Acidimicrobiia bacterium]|nr:HNH endonuclease [Acidimicrobiia bacterium]